MEDEEDVGGVAQHWRGLSGEHWRDEQRDHQRRGQRALPHHVRCTGLRGHVAVATEKLHLAHKEQYE
jgi:hypothetical protein